MTKKIENLRNKTMKEIEELIERLYEVKENIDRELYDEDLGEIRDEVDEAMSAFQSYC